MRVVYQKASFRILEKLDLCYDLEDLKGDCFNPDCNPEINPLELKSQEVDFEQQVIEEGVFGYVFEEWNPKTGKGWEELDACWGFVGQFDDDNSDHYIVNEFKEEINKRIYLDWVNNFLSIKKFAEYYEMTENEANQFLNSMRNKVEINVENI